MTTTAKLLTCCLVVTLSLAAAPAAMAQSGQNVDRAQYDQHLQQARRALTDGNLDEVEFHIQQAEQSGVKSGRMDMGPS